MRKYKVILKLVKISWEINKKYFLFLFLSSILNTLLTISVMYIPPMIIDMLISKYTFADIVKSVFVFIALTYLLKQISELINEKFYTLNILQCKNLEAKIAEKSLSIPYKELENPKSLDLIQRAEMPILWGIVSTCLEAIKNTLLNLLTILGIITILINHSLLYTVTIFAILIISIFIRLKMQNKYEALIQENIPVNRKLGYFFNALVAPENQKEFRIFNLSEIMASKMHQYNLLAQKWFVSFQRAEANLEILNVITTSLINFIAISYNTIRLFSKSLGAIISIGQFTLIYNATNKIMESMKQIAVEISNINRAATHLSPWNDYMELKDECSEGDVQAEEFETLEFKNVYFTYPNSKALILDGVSFKINKGEKISVVGLNNAGKSTIVKLITRFYKPDRGEILWNGKNIYEYEEVSYIKQISAVFQDFKLFPYTILENIMPYEGNQKKAEDALRKVNMYDEVSKLKKGIYTYLSKDLEEDSTKFSGGQSQKIAIARAINKDGSLMILDEPTAALDPISESEIFENFAHLTNGKTVIFISHRMSSSIFSDKILLLNKGKIIGFDNHNNLMKEHNLYKELFETQAKNYI